MTSSKASCLRRAVKFLLAAAIALPAAAPAAKARPGHATMAWHVTIPPAWFDPSTAPPQVTPFGMLFALHEALVRPYPGHPVGASLAESWSESPDGKMYEFRLRPGLTFHNGDPVTADDVLFSFERYRGTAAASIKAHVDRVEMVDPLTVRFHLNQAWPDFMTYFGTTASAVGLVVPKAYIQRVGDEGFRKHPIGAGPYRFVSHKPGLEVELEAFPGYWRRVPAVKSITMKSVPEHTTRAVMVRTGEADFAFALDGLPAEALQRGPGTKIVATKHASIFWIEFPKQWNPASPWHDIRLRRAVNLALNREAINQAACLGFCPPAGVIVPRVMEYALQVPPGVYDLKEAKRLVAEAGYPNGIDAGDFVAIPGFATVAEAVVNDLRAAGINVRMRAMERASFISAWQEKKLGAALYMPASGNAGNAASRAEAFIQSKGAYANGGYPDIDALFEQQSQERDPARRQALLYDIQQKTIDRAMFAPVMDLRALVGIGPRVVKHTVGDVWMSAYPSYEDVELTD